MRLEESRSVLREVDGKGYSWLKQWGLSTVREAIRTVRSRVSATKADLLLAEQIKTKLDRKW